MKFYKPKLRSPVQVRQPVRVSTQAGTDLKSNLGQAFPIHTGRIFRVQSPAVSLSLKLQTQPLRMTANDWKRRFFPRHMHNSLLFRIGAFTAKEARDSIKYRKNPRNASRPGTPPHAHKPGSRRWFRMIQFGYYNGGVIVGSVYFHNKGNTNLTVPEAQEHGGNKIISFRQVTGKVGKKKESGRVRSQRELEAIRRKIGSREILTQSRKIVAKYKKRSFMEPALLRVKQKNSKLFKGLR